MVKRIYLIKILCITILSIYLLNVGAYATVYTITPKQQVIGELQVIPARHNDVLIKIAREFDLGYEELIAANPDIDPWQVKEGTKILLPSLFILPPKKKGIHINLTEYRLYYYPTDKADEVWSFPISIGRGNWPTPTGEIKIVDKITNPNWYPTKSILEEHLLAGDPLPRVVLPGPKNPLGKYALQLSVDGYFIHGTNRPYGIGMEATHGCIRLRPENIQMLFQHVPRERNVYISREPFKFAIQEEVIYFEANPGQTDSEQETSRQWMQAINDLINDTVKKEQYINYEKLMKLVMLREGVPRIINLGELASDSLITEVARPSTNTVADVAELAIF